MTKSDSPERIQNSRHFFTMPAHGLMHHLCRAAPSAALLRVLFSEDVIDHQTSQQGTGDSKDLFSSIRNDCEVPKFTSQDSHSCSASFSSEGSGEASEKGNRDLTSPRLAMTPAPLNRSPSTNRYALHRKDHQCLTRVPFEHKL